MNYSAIKPVDIANGIGVRVSLFVSGCPHHCKGCFNAETWDYDHGDPFTDDTAHHIVTLLKPDWIHGLSLLGGEPLVPRNIDTVAGLVKRVKELYPDKTIWCYTGYSWDEVRQHPIMDHIDVLVDGQFIEAERDISLQFRGSRNQRIIDVPKSLATDSVVLWETDPGMKPSRR